MSQPSESSTALPAQPGHHPFDLRTASNLTGDWGGARTALEKAGFSLELFHMEQYQQNYRGGLKVHNASRYSGSTDIHPIVDLGKFGLVPGGLLFLEAKSHWGPGINGKIGAWFDPNADIVGDYPIYLNKWWYRQYFFEQKIELRVGVLETKKDDLFDISPYAHHEDKDFWNFSVLRDTTLPHKTGAGAFLRLKPVASYYFQTAVLDAQNPARHAQIRTAFHEDPRYIGYWETGLTPQWPGPNGKLPGKYRVGWWYDGRDKTIFQQKSSRHNSAEPEVETGDMGYYLGLDQVVWKERSDPADHQGLALFSRYGADDRSRNKIENYWELGMSDTGLIPTRDHDVAALAFAQSVVSKKYRHEIDSHADTESVYEFYYQIQITPWCLLTPDFQVIVNPGGDTHAADAMVGGIRVRIIF